MEQLAVITRRLAAIAFADVVGWSRLIEQNDVETQRAWKALRSNLIEPKFREHGGRLVHTIGDAVLVEFSSAVGAVTWAIEVQRVLGQQGPPAAGGAAAGTPPLQLRISINIEDVIVDDETLIGDGVNVAARILQLGGPGDIVVTTAVMEYLRNKMTVTFDDLGERELKNISRPVRIFRVGQRTGEVAAPAHRQPHLFWTRRPGIAVLPMRNDGGAPEEQYFSEGITEDIIRGLTRSHSLYVIARNSTLRYRDRQMGPQEIASELGVRYVLDSSVRRHASRLRISSDLVDASSSRTVWAEKFDSADTEIFELQDRIATRIVGAIEPQLRRAETARAFSKPTDSLDAYDCVLRAMAVLYSFQDRQFLEAGDYLQRAIALDPHYAQAHAYLAWWLNLMVGEGRSVDPKADHQRAISAAMRAIELDPDDAFCLAVAGHVQAFMNGSLDTALDLFERAFQTNENCAFAWGVSGSTYSFLGRPQEALDNLRNAWRLSPFDSMNFWFFTVAGLAEFVAGHCEQAIAWLRKAQRLNPRFSACQRTMAAAAALAGHLEEARAAAKSVLEIEPGFRISSFTSWYPLSRSSDLDRLAEGLRLAGLPE